MLRKTLLTILLIVLMAQAHLAVAQFYPRYGGFGGGWGGGGWGGGGWGGGWGGGMTVAQGAGIGMAAVVQSEGQYNLMSSMAAINLEQARQKDLQNQLEATKTYFEMRRVNREARAAERGPAASPEDWVRYARDAAPKPLTDAQIDRSNGTLQWPTILQQPQYTPMRDELDSLFAERATLGGSAGAIDPMAVRRAAQSMFGVLRDHIKDYTPGDYLVARRFIDGLESEARVSQPTPAG